jgi:hypothetical protein
MPKMNRRNYLKSMAASTAAIAGSQLEVFAHVGRRRSQPAIQGDLVIIDPMVDYFQQWPRTETLPPSPNVQITFHGLLDFYYNSSGSNERTLGVGFPKGGGHHSRIVEIFENRNPQPTQSIQIRNKELRLGVVRNPNQQLSPKVEFFKKVGRDENFHRFIDMQSRPWYKGVSTKEKPEYAARLFVRQGTFFTKKRTKFLLHQVKKVESGSTSYVKRAELGQPGEILGGAINLAPNQKVLLNVNGSNIPLPYDASKKYEIRFSHLCPHNASGPCHFDPHHFEEGKRNDFHHHRDVLDLPDFSEKYTVVLAPDQKVNIESNDAAPCMGTGYGGGNGPS